MSDFSTKILVVDDYATIRRIIKNILEQIGYTNIDEASDGSMALQKLRGARYDLIISDWTVESMTGLELLREVRADATLKAIPFILVTNDTNRENVMQAKEAGVSNYLTKPFSANTLKQKLDAVLS